MTARPLIVIGCLVLAVVAGVWAGGAVTPSPRSSAALARLDSARVGARVRLHDASTASAQRAAALALARLHRDAARSLRAERGPLTRTADAYDALARASQPGSYAQAAHDVAAAEAALAPALLARTPDGPAIPPALPLILFCAAAAGVAVTGRRRRSTETAVAAASPRPPATAQTPAAPRRHAPAWDTPPPGI